MSTDNLLYYNKFKEVPAEAKKKIEGGRLNGFTDINSMFRIKTITEAFGACGIGWYTKLVNERIVPGGDKGEVAVFVDIELYYKTESGWSEPVFGTGGSKLVTLEKSGLRLDDEAFKKANTDAFGVACKALGVGADVYWDKDTTKYSGNAEEPAKEEPAQPSEFVGAEEAKLRKIILDLAKAAKRDEAAAMKFCKEVILASTGNSVDFDDMNVGELTFCKVKLAEKIAGK